MTEVNKNAKSIQKKSSGNRKFILLLIAVVILGAYLIIDLNPRWLQEIRKHNPQATKQDSVVKNNNSFPESKKQLSLKPEEANGCLLPETLPVSNDEIINFAPKDEAEKFPADDSNDLNPYEVQDESQTQEIEINSEILANNLNDYRIFLANMNEMMIKFSKDADYSNNLAIITQIDFPPRIKEIIEMLEAYNKMIEGERSKSEQVLLFNSNLFEKFLKITKESPSHTKMKELKIKIEKNVDLLNDYIFSSDLQEMFLK